MYGYVCKNDYTFSHYRDVLCEEHDRAWCYIESLFDLHIWFGVVISALRQSLNNLSFFFPFFSQEQYVSDFDVKFKKKKFW
jgi:hypothetical protein